MRYIAIIAILAIGCSGSSTHHNEAVVKATVPICNKEVAWDAVPNIDYYQVWIAGEIYRTRKTKFDISFLPRGRYTVKVRSVNLYGLQSDWVEIIISKRV